MAEATALRNNALNYPIYGAPYTIIVPILDNDGDPVTSAAGLDSERSLNGDSLADCTNEATEIGGGLYYLSLTGTELMADVVSGVTKTSTTDAKTTTWAVYPRKLVTVRSGTSAGGAVGYITLDGSASAVDDYYNGMVCIATVDSNVEVRVITDYTGSNKQAAVTPEWNGAPVSDDTFIIKLPEGVQIPTVDVTLWKGATAPANTGDAYAVVSHADYGNAKLVRSTTPANTLDVDASGNVVLADDSITSAKFDESSAYPLQSADTGSTKVARTGADSDTLETLSDQLDGVGASITAQEVRDAMKLAPTAGAPAAGSVDTHLDDIKTKTDQLTFTVPLSVDATATVDEAAIAAAVIAGMSSSLTVAISAAEADSVASGNLAIRTHHTLSQSITSTNTLDLSAATKVWLAVKQHKTDDDDDAIVFVEKSAGLTYLAGEAYATTTDGSLTVTGSSGAWVITAKVQEAATAELTDYVDRSLVAELKALVAGDTVPVWDGAATISHGIVQAYA